MPGSGGFAAPHRGRFESEGMFYLASADNDSVLRYDGATGAFSDASSPTAAAEPGTTCSTTRST